MSLRPVAERSAGCGVNAFEVRPSISTLNRLESESALRASTFEAVQS